MFISVVIAVKNEKQYIQKCIESLFDQRYDGGYEVIVVDGMSNDGTYELLLTLQEQYHFELYRNEKKNAAAGRNIGITHAQGSIIAFIDGDAVAASDWLSEIQKAFEERNEIGVGGPDLLPEDSIYKSKALATIMTSPLATGGKINPSTQHAMSTKNVYAEHIPTCNLSLKKEIFTEVGKFDEDFVKGQDLELNYRIVKAGYKLFYSPKVKVVHYRKQHVRHFSRQIFKWAKAKVAIIKKHGMQGFTSYIYLWPVLLLIAFLLSFSFFIIFNVMHIFISLFFLALILYSYIVLYESARLSKEHGDKKLFLYALPLFPIVHLSYCYGTFVALMRIKIW